MYHWLLCGPNSAARVLAHSVRIQSRSWLVALVVFSDFSRLLTESRSSGQGVLRIHIKMDSDAFTCYLAGNYCVYFTGSPRPHVFSGDQCNIRPRCYGSGFKLYYTYLFVRVPLFSDFWLSPLLQTSRICKSSRSPIQTGSLLYGDWCRWLDRKYNLHLMDSIHVCNLLVTHNSSRH